MDSTWIRRGFDVDLLAKTMQNAMQVLDPSVASSQFYESMGIRLQRANARAVLSRTSACDVTAIATTRSEAALVMSAAPPFAS